MSREMRRLARQQRKPWREQSPQGVQSVSHHSPTLDRGSQRESRRRPSTGTEWKTTDATHYPTLECQDPDAGVITEAAYVSRRYVQLKTGHAMTGTYLHRIGKAETDRCCECTMKVRMDTHHTMCDFRRWRKESRKIRDRCNKDGGGDNLEQ